MLGQGKDEEEIKAELGLNDRDWTSYRNMVVDQEKVDAGRPPIEVFVEYQLRQLEHVEQLEKARAKAMDTGHPQHAVSAIKVKAELLDKIIQRGQDLGIYHREGQKVTVGGAMGLVHMSPKQLVEQLDKSVVRLKALADDLGHPLELSNIVRTIGGNRGPLRIIETTADETPVLGPGTADEPEPRVVDPDEDTDPGPPPVDPPPDPAAPEHIEPEETTPERKPKYRGTKGLQHGDGDPGPGAPLEERLLQAAMHPRPGAGGVVREQGEIRGDPAGLRAKICIQCPKCPKRIYGTPTLARHISFLHQVPEGEALQLAQAAAERDRMSMAREFAEKVKSGEAQLDPDVEIGEGQ